MHQPDNNEDRALDQCLQRLPDAPISSNFTAQVMAAVERERRAAELHSSRRFRLSNGWGWLSRRWAHATLGVALTLGVCLFSFQQYQSARREEMAHSVVTVSSVAGLPPLELLEDFEAIRRLKYVPQDVDLELVAALQSL